MEKHCKNAKYKASHFCLQSVHDCYFRLSITSYISPPQAFDRAILSTLPNFLHRLVPSLLYLTEE